MPLPLQPGILSQTDLDNMRIAFSGVYQTPVDIYRQTVTDDGEGGRTYKAGGSYVKLISTVCHIAWSTHRPPHEDFQSTIDRVESQAFYICLLPLGTNIRAKDRLLVDGAFYEVQAIITDRSFSMDERVQITALDHRSP